MYERVGLTEAEWREKVIVYSDGVSMEKAIKLREHCEEIGFKREFYPRLSLASIKLTSFMFD